MQLNRRQFSIAASAALVGGVNIAKADSESKIVLGQSAAFSGPAAQLGIQFNSGAQIYFDQVNAQGGINKRLIELRTLDDGYEPARCAENTRKLLGDDVFALFGYIGTPTSLVALPEAIKAQTPFIAPFTGAMALREPFSKYAFHIRASYDDETGLIVKHLTNLSMKRIAVFYQNDAYGKAGLSGVVKALKTKELKPVAEASVERNSKDVGASIKTLLAASPEAIVQISAYGASAAFIREARKAGYGGLFYNVSFVGTQALANDLGTDGAGIVISQVMPSPYAAAKPIAREFQVAVKTAGKGADANFSSMEGYIAAKVFVEGLKRAGPKPNRETLITGLEKIGSNSLSGFNVEFGPNDHVASKYVDISMLRGDGTVRT